MVRIFLLCSFLIINNIFGNFFDLDIIFSYANDRCSCIVYRDQRINDIFKDFEELLQGPKIENSQGEFGFSKQDIKKVTNYTSTKSKRKILYIDKIYQDIVVGIHCQDNGERFMFYFDCSSDQKREQQGDKLFETLSKLGEENKKCKISLVSYYYSQNVKSILEIIKKTRYNVDCSKIKPLYLLNPLDSYHTNDFRFLLLSNDFTLNIGNISQGSNLVILPDGRFLCAKIESRSRLKKKRNIKILKEAQ